ncbi:MAG: collagen-like protein, partial [Methylococcaceae bacterium]
MSITDAYAADYNAITHLIILNNVKISGNPNLSTTLTPTDGAGIHAGQVWSLSTGNATGAQDAQYTSDGKLYIPNLVQDAFITYNASFLLTNVAPLEFTVLDITTTSFSNGAETKVVFNQGVKGDAGLQGSQGAQGLKGDTGSQGLKGDTGAIGLKGAAGYQGIDGTTGLQG